MKNPIDAVLIDEVNKFRRSIESEIANNPFFKINAEVHEKISCRDKWEIPYRTMARLDHLSDLAQNLRDVEYLKQVLPKYMKLLPRVENKHLQKHIKETMDDISRYLESAG